MHAIRHRRCPAAFGAVLCGLLLPGEAANANAIFFQTVACAPGQSVCDISDADPITSAPGVTTSDMVINAPGLYLVNDTMDNLTLTLLGFQHPEAGDLIVSLTNVSAGITRDVFYRMGTADPNDTNDPGFLANFGGNYDFNGSYLLDLWVTAGGLGDSDIIPDDTQGSLYFPLTINHQASDLSKAFNGLPISGTWRLTITDMVTGPNDPFTPPQFNGWSLTMNVVPEPSYMGVFGVLAFIGWQGLRSLKSQRDR